MQLTKNERNDLKETIRSLRNYQAEYHNHKENMAWVAIVVYIGGLAAIIGFIYGLPVKFALEAIDPISYLFFIISFSSLIVITLLFIRGQLFARKRAADVVAACLRLEFKLIRGDPFERESLMKINDNSNYSFWGFLTYFLP